MEHIKFHSAFRAFIFSARGSQISLKKKKKPGSHLQIRGVRMVDLQFREWPTNLTVIWLFPLGACELIHIFVCKAEILRNYTENIRGLPYNIQSSGQPDARV